MNKFNITLSAVTLLAASTAFAEVDESVKTESSYEKKSGVVERTTKTAKSTDPDGLGNKTWSEKTQKTKVDAKGSFSGDVAERSVDSSGTAKTVEESVAKDLKSDGTRVTTAEKRVVSDPKGLMNKTDTETETKVVEHPDGRKDTTIKVDGQ